MSTTNLLKFGESFGDKGGLTMPNKKTPEELELEKKELKKQAQVTENTFNDRNRIPDEQNAWKETQPQYGYNKTD